MAEYSKYKNLAVNTVLFALNSVATKLVTFMLVPLYTAYMTAGEYGLTDMSLTVINLVTPLVTLDVADAAVRFIVSDRARSDMYTTVSIGVTIVSIAIVAVFAPLLDLPAFGGLGNYKVWFIAAYAASALLNLCGEVTRGMGRVKIIPICASASSVVTLTTAVLTIGWARMGVSGYFISVVVGPVIGISLYIWLGGLGDAIVRGFRQLGSLTKEGVWSLVRPMMRYALPLIPNSLFWWLSSGINRLYITSALGISASGMFAAASKVPNLLNTVYSIFLQAWQLSAFQESGETGLEHFFSRVFAFVQAGMTILCATLSFLAPWVAAVLLRGETYEAWPMIAPLLLSNLFNVLASFYGTVYSTTMRTSFIMWTTVLGSLSCVVLTPLFLPVMGTYGVCVASMLGQGAVFLARAVDSRRYLRFNVGWRFLVPTLLLLVIQAAVTEMTPMWWREASLACLVGVVAIQGARVLCVLCSTGGVAGLPGRGRD